jgi:hypothetical protein
MSNWRLAGLPATISANATSQADWNNQKGSTSDWLTS